MSSNKRGLGRGLGALIPTAPEAVPGGQRPADVFFGSDQAAASRQDGVAVSSPLGGAESNTAASDLVPVPGARFAYLPLADIVPNSRQPRTYFDEEALQELIGSIAEIGVLQPIVVRANADGGYELIMGERRFRASKEAGLTDIPAIIRETEDTDMLRDALVENLHRSQLNPLEEAAAYQQLLDDFELTHEQLAEKISRSRPQISNTLRLLKLPPVVQRRVAAGVLSAGHARALLGLESPEAMDHLATRIVAEGLSVRATEEAVTLGVSAPTAKGKIRAGKRTDLVDELATRLGDHLDTRVRINVGRSKGTIAIEFATIEDLNRIAALINPQEKGLGSK